MDRVVKMAMMCGVVANIVATSSIAVQWKQETKKRELLAEERGALLERKREEEVIKERRMTEKTLSEMMEKIIAGEDSRCCEEICDEKCLPRQ